MCFPASRTTIEQLQNEINLLDSRIKKVRKQIDLPSTETEIKSQMVEFLQVRFPSRNDFTFHLWFGCRYGSIASDGGTGGGNTAERHGRTGERAKVSGRVLLRGPGDVQAGGLLQDIPRVLRQVQASCCRKRKEKTAGGANVPEKEAAGGAIGCQKKAM